jgi:anti-sigma factor RsiW
MMAKSPNPEADDLTVDSSEPGRGPGRPRKAEGEKRETYGISMLPAAMEQLKAAAKRAGQSQGALIESLLGKVPAPVNPTDALDPWRVDRLIDAIATVQSELRHGVELSALDRHNVAPVQTWLIALRTDIERALGPR